MSHNAVEQLERRLEELRGKRDNLAMSYAGVGEDAFIAAKTSDDKGLQGWGMNVASDCYLNAMRLLPSSEDSEQFETLGRKFRGCVSSLIYLGMCDPAEQFIERALAIEPTFKPTAAELYLQLAESVAQERIEIKTKELDYLLQMHQLDGQLNPWLLSVRHIDFASRAFDLHQAEWHLKRAFDLYETTKPINASSSLDSGFTPHMLISGLFEGIGVVLQPLDEDKQKHIRLLKVEDFLRHSFDESKYKRIPKTTGYIEIARRAAEEGQFEMAESCLNEALRIATHIDRFSRPVHLRRAFEECDNIAKIAEQKSNHKEAKRFKDQVKRKLVKSVGLSEKGKWRVLAWFKALLRV